MDQREKGRERDEGAKVVRETVSDNPERIRDKKGSRDRNGFNGNDQSGKRYSDGQVQIRPKSDAGTNGKLMGDERAQRRDPKI